MKTQIGSEPKFKTGNHSNEPTLNDLFLDALQDIYWAENHLVKTLPKMIKASSNAELTTALNNHLQETATHVDRLKQAFNLLDADPIAKKCDAMEGLTKEGEGIIESTQPGTATRDVGIILAAQKVEHYEIATYGRLAQLAKTQGHENIAKLLEQTLEEEKNADVLLTEIAESKVNYQASNQS